MVKWISPPDFVIQSLIGIQQVRECQYNWSQYVLRKEVDGGLLCYNTLTCELGFITPLECNDTETNRELISRWFLVPDQVDEYQRAKRIKRIRQTVYRADAKKKWNGSIDKYWILTTTKCNARCFYCHEKGIPLLHMDKSMAQEIVRYIGQKCLSMKAHIMWYGGEPLVNADIIDLISSGLEKLGIRYTSSMISNGYAFDEAMTKKAHDLWNLTEVQITLDGKEDTYNRIKSYSFPEDESPFQRVLHNIERLLSFGIKVHIRLNIDTYNQEELFDLAEYLIRRYGNSPHFFIYSAPLLENCLGTTYTRKASQRKAVYDAHFRLREMLDSAGVLLKTELPKAMRSEVRCIAVSDVRVIFPDGQLAFCHDYSEGILSGNIFDCEPADEERLLYTKCLPEAAECKECPKYPQCVRFEKCFKSQCNEDLLREWIMCTEQEMVWEYQKSQKNENNLQNNGGCFLEIH